MLAIGYRLAERRRYEILLQFHRLEQAKLIHRETGKSLRLTDEGIALAQSLGVAHPGRAAHRASVALPRAQRTTHRGLTEEQLHALSMCELGRNVFLTGSAGTGKSFVLRRIISTLRAQRRRVFVTAPTGIAACALGGMTIHSFAGIGPGTSPVAELVARVRRSGRSLQRWRDADVIVVDEVSMMDADLFEKLDSIARAARDRDAPFGGIQVILCGDFFQLPPVARPGTTSERLRFCFESPRWTLVVSDTVVLRRAFRQKDPAFVRFLNQLRIGKLDDRGRSILSRLQANSVGDDAVHIFSHNAEASALNATCLANQAGAPVTYTCSHTVSHPGSPLCSSLLRQVERSCLAPEQLSLKRSSPVVLLLNLDQARGLVNGTRGTVVGFDWSSQHPRKSQLAVEADAPVQEPPNFGGFAPPFPIVDFHVASHSVVRVTLGREAFRVEDGEVAWAARWQVPVRLAHALSIHKSQGMTLSNVHVSLGKVFEFGQAYVALSRASTLDGLAARGFHPGVLRVHPRVKRFYDSLMGEEGAESWSFVSPENPRGAEEVVSCPRSREMPTTNATHPAHRDATEPLVTLKRRRSNSPEEALSSSETDSVTSRPRKRRLLAPASNNVGATTGVDSKTLAGFLDRM